VAKKLTSYVHVPNPDTGRTEVFGPDDDLPRWASEAITNPKAFTGDDVEDDEPPRSGKGSGKGAWADYAEELGVAVPADASKEDIIALVDSFKATAPQG